MHVLTFPSGPYALGTHLRPAPAESYAVTAPTLAAPVPSYTITGGQTRTVTVAHASG